MCRRLYELTPAEVDPSGATALENPPWLIVSDSVRFRIHTNWSNSVSRTRELTLDDLASMSVPLAATGPAGPGGPRHHLGRDGDAKSHAQSGHPVPRTTNSVFRSVLYLWSTKKDTPDRLSANQFSARH